jgi:gliding motility-associated-like protein
VTVTEPETELSCETSLDNVVTCVGGTDGEASVTPTGGWGGYSYLWSDGQTSATATGLAAGTYSVTVTDAEGCETSCQVTVTEPETELSCTTEETPVTCIGDSDGEATVNPIGGWGDYSYNWSGPNGFTADTKTISELVSGTYTVTVTDAEGCETSCSAEITVLDTEPPVLTGTIPQGETGMDLCLANIPAGPTEAEIAAQYTDNYSNANVNKSAVYGEENADCSWTVTYSYTIEDDCGNKAEPVQVTYSGGDTSAPIIACNSNGLTIRLRDNGIYILSNAEINTLVGSVTDNCSNTEDIEIEISPRSFSCNDAGQQVPLTVTATDLCGNVAECQTVITVIDNISPHIFCPEDITVPVAEDACSAVVNFEVEATDNCDVTVAYSHEPGSEFPVGTTTVTATASDASGNSSSCTFDITVADDESPVVTCPENITVSADETECGAIVQFEATVTDNCTTTPSISYSHEPGTLFPVGTTTVTVTATDDSGNSSSCSFDVTVTDDEIPFISCPADIEVTTEAGECEASVLVPEPPTMGDNCNFTYSNDFNDGTDASGIYPAGTTVVTWTITDGSGNTASCSMTVTVVAAPDAVDDQASTPEDTAVDIDILANDVDCNNSLDPASVTITSAPANGTVTVNNETGLVTYTPAMGHTGTDEFTYSVCNAEGLCDEALVTITIVSVNKPPIATDDINETLVNYPTNGWVTTNDYDPDGDQLIVNTTPLSNPTNGSLSLNADGSYTYTPNSDFIGKDHFEYEVCDPYGLCDVALVTISVVPEKEEDENRPPVAIEDNYKGKVNTPVTGNLLANDYDPDGDNISIATTPVSSPSSGTLQINADGTFTFVPENDFFGIVTFVYRICDDGTPSLCDEATVTIDIRYVEEINTTVGVDDAWFIVEDSLLQADVSLNDYDPEGDNQVSFTLLVPPANGSMALFPDGTFEFEPFAGFIGNDFFIYEVCDDGSPVACDKATAYIIVEKAPVDTIPGEPGEQETCELFIPEGFSPNDDNNNDYFEIVCLEDYPNAKIEIYNRWGNLLYEKEDYGNTDHWGSVDAWWDGRSNKKWTLGKEKLPPGTYFYILYLNDGSDPITGSVFLNR